MSSNVASAVHFLRDPSVQNAPLAKKIEFLESKGLNKTEIDAALSQSSLSQPFPRSYAPVPYDWRDWFIMTVIGGGLAYVATSLARKYLVPALSPPDQTQLEQAQDALTKKYDEAAALLEQIKQDAEETKNSVLAQQAKVDAGLTDVQEAVAAFKARDEQRTEELKTCRDEVDSLKEMLPKMLEKTKEAQTQSLSELQTELRSLKTLLAASKQDSSTPRFGIGTSPFSNAKTNGLPAWQLAGSSQIGKSPSSTSINGSNGTTTPDANESSSIKEITS